MKILPFDMVADWQPEPEAVFTQLGKDLVSLVATVAFLAAILASAVLVA